MIAYDIPSTVHDISGYAGKIASFVAEEREKSRDRLEKSIVLGLAAKGTFQELDEVYEECSSAGWDGEQAEPISREVVEYTILFLESFPLGIEAPEISAEPDGAITLEWYRSPTRVISISINPDGWIYYAALIGTSRRHGGDCALIGVSDDILKLISQVINTR